ncbi:MAG: beta-hydroxyacyl-ACP dehydratase [Sedimentisphaerales bacterium]|nr:beta-hydroxyacyl-ACP dehydratase [Sedimentisphaerales bacterium]
MKFILLDKVTEIVPGEKISAVKALSLAEEYLADHFPEFPVLPGVMMIEALVQTAAMLVRVTNGFDKSMIVLQEARNVKYKSFVKPGNLLKIDVQAKSIEPESSSFLASAAVDGKPMVEARIKLRHFNLADEQPKLASLDQTLIKNMKQRAKLVGAC